MLAGARARMGDSTHRTERQPVRSWNVFSVAASSLRGTGTNASRSWPGSWTAGSTIETVRADRSGIRLRAEATTTSYETLTSPTKWACVHCRANSCPWRRCWSLVAGKLLIMDNRLHPLASNIDTDMPPSIARCYGVMLQSATCKHVSHAASGASTILRVSRMSAALK